MNIHEVLYQYWGYKQFRPLQEDIIQSIMDGKDTLALLPTGGGKSICFQVPAMALNGLCLVISPLIALIKDQVESLNKKNIPALMIYSGMPFKQVDNILKNAINGKYKFLYVSPERLETKLFLEYLPAMDISLIAVDEAHCISQWGYDFRPPYLRIATIREQLKNVPVIALTASATKIVQKDICEKLLFTKENIFQKSFKRPNLSYSIFEVESKINKTVEILNKVQGTAIVYCKSRKRTKEVSDLLRLYNINAGYYNAGLTNEERSEKQQLWIDNKIRVMVCTNAFGMGIDKPDVRVVIHFDTPDFMENYYQEAGRAGRDEQKAFAVLLYQQKDVEQLFNSVHIKYPKEEDIKNVYLSICNFLQITYGSAEGQYFDFDINQFAKTFKLDILLVMNSLKVLEQEGLLSFTESVFMPPSIQFTCTKNALYDFEKQYPKLEDTIKTLLRTYSGIFDFPIFINEKNIAYLLKQDVDIIKKQLYQLHQFNIIEYKPVKDLPQLFFIKERIHSDNFRINTTFYNLRKQNYQDKVDQMIAFLQLKNNCRSTFISNYFGVEDTENCTICDNCIAKKKKELAAKELEKYINIILEKIKLESQVSIKSIKLFWEPEKMQKAINHLIAEEKIVLKGDYLMTI